MKKLTALLAAVLLLALAACAKEPEATPTVQPTQSTKPILTAPTDPTVPEGVEPVESDGKFQSRVCAPLFGTWKTPIVLDGTMMNMPDFEGSVTFDILYTFQSTGLFTVSADMEAVQNAIVEYEAMLTTYMVEGFHNKFSAECKLEGMTNAQIEAAWIAGEDLVSLTRAQSFVESIGLTERFSSIVRYGDYYVEKDILYLATGEDTYEACRFKVSGGLLYLISCSNASAYVPMRLEFPLTLWPEGTNYEDLTPEPIEPEPTDPTPTDPTAPTETQPTVPDPTEPTTPTPTVPTPTVPTPTVPTPTAPTPTVPTPTAPTPTVPTPTVPTPTVPAPTQPTEPAPTQPKPTEPKPTVPEVTEPEVTEPEITEPEVTEPEVTEPEITEPEVTEPETTEPEVTEPEITEPEPTEPEISE